mgnify:CR=1 FL=1
MNLIWGILWGLGAQIVTFLQLQGQLKYDWMTRPDPDKLLLALRQHQEVHVVGMVHHETTTGLINPVQEIADIVDSQNRVFVLDAVFMLIAGLWWRGSEIWAVYRKRWKQGLAGADRRRRQNQSQIGAKRCRSGFCRRQPGCIRKRERRCDRYRW